MIIVTATFAQAFSGSGHAMSIVSALILWRFIMGVGVGGHYPLSAVIASEFAPRRNRGRLMTTGFTAISFLFFNHHVIPRAHLFPSHRG